MRIARLPVEDAAQPERAGATARHRHAHVQRRGFWQGLREGRHDDDEVIALALVAGLVGRRQVHRAGRDVQPLFAVLLGRDRIDDFAHGRAVFGRYRDTSLAGRGCQGNADQRDPFDRVTEHQQRCVAGGHRTGSRRSRAKRQTRNAARHLRRLGPDIGGRRRRDA